MDNTLVSWHCCYAPCPAASQPGTSAILLAICLANGASLSSRLLPNSQEAACKTASTAADRTSSMEDVYAARVAANCSMVQQVLAELLHTRLAATGSLEQERLEPCRLTVMRLGFMEDEEMAAWNSACSSVAQEHAGGQNCVNHISELLVACCTADAPCRQACTSTRTLTYQILGCS